MSRTDDSKLAQRKARVIASDLAHYHEDKVVKGILEDSLFQVLALEIAEGREHYQAQVAPSIVETENYYEQALVDVLIHGKGHIKSKIW